MNRSSNTDKHAQASGPLKADPVSRRSFIDLILGGGAILMTGSLTYPVWRYLVPPERGEAEPNAVLATTVDKLPPNSGVVFPFGRKPAIVIRTPDGELRAFTAVCTHLGCTVQYRKDLEHIWCACHNGHFDLMGRNIAGPPPRPLEQYDVNVKDGKVFVSKKRSQA